VRQVTVEGHSVPEVAKRLGVTTKSLYDWKRVYGESPERAARFKADQAENQRLKKELKRVVPTPSNPYNYAARLPRFRACSGVRWPSASWGRRVL
jgi:transposase-like protein